MVSGGSLVSASVTCAATTVTVQVTPLGRLALGLSTKLLAGPVPVMLLKPIGVPTGHSSVKALPVTFTGSLKVIVMLVSDAWFVAPLAGTVVVTVGAASVPKLNT